MVNGIHRFVGQVAVITLLTKTPVSLLIGSVEITVGGGITIVVNVQT